MFLWYSYFLYYQFTLTPHWQLLTEEKYVKLKKVADLATFSMIYNLLIKPYLFFLHRQFF